jgi:tetratricopeptide (TPR) repeat protein
MIMKRIGFSILLILSVFLYNCQETYIPITTNSQEARDLYIQGLDLMQRLRAPESVKYFEKAVQLDTNFALAYFNLSVAAENAMDRLRYLEKAKSKIDDVSKGERLLILGFDAATMGNPGKQLEYFEELVRIYPKDVNAHMTLGNQYFGTQKYDLAIEQFKIATQLDPQFSQIYNQLGYAYRFMGDYTKAEAAFKKYISLLPNDPNPYDSYAELLLEMGEYEVSIENYEKAIELNPDFANSYMGIATNLNIKGEHGLARKKLKELYFQVKNEGIRRQALGAMAISFVDQGKYDQALNMIEKRLENSKASMDTLAMVGDHNLMGIILLDEGNVDAADEKFSYMMTLVNKSNSPTAIKKAWQRVSYYWQSRSNLMREKLDQAWKYQKMYLQAAIEVENVFQIKAAHELAGMILFAEEKYDRALSEFEKSNLQNPYNIYRIGLVYKAKGDLKSAKQYFEKSANANSFNSLNYSFVRRRAEIQLQKLLKPMNSISG